MARRNYRQRRGLSTVVGAVFMIIVMVAALNLTLWTIQQQDRVTQTVIEKTNQNLNKLNEDIQISNVRVSGGKLNLTASNPGGAAATIKSIYLVNETAKTQYTYDLDIPVDGRDAVSNIGQVSPAIGLKDDKEYTVKIVTESGNTATAKMKPVSQVALPMSLFVLPSTVIPTQNVTLLFAVTNNLTDSELAGAVTPKLNHTFSAGCIEPSCKLTLKSPEPTAQIIEKGSTAFFKWVYKVDAPDDITITFNASLTTAKTGNYVIERALANHIDSSLITGTTEIVGASLVQKPEIFLVIPGLFGESSQNGLWGIVVVNPTNQPMTVSRLDVNVYTSVTSASHQIIQTSTCSGLGLTQILPSTGWTCPHDGLIEWQGSPIELKGFEAKSWLARVAPGNLGANDPEPAFMITVTVFTSFGQFSKTGYSSNMFHNAASLANVYATDTNSTSVINGATNNAHMFGNLSGFKSNQVKRIYVAIADLDTNSATTLTAGTKLIVNVPSGFTVLNGTIAGTNDLDMNNLVRTKYLDGSEQLIVPILNAIGNDVGLAEAEVLTFKVRAPTITNNNKVYIMHVLEDGFGNTSPQFPVSGFAGIALHVKP